MDLPRDPKNRKRLLEELAKIKPDVARAFVQRHPANLMVYMDWEVEAFHRQAFDEALSHSESLWLAPRGSGKSTTLGVFLPSWLAISPPEMWDSSIPNLFPDAPSPIGPHNIRIALTSNSVENAASLLWQSKAILQSPKIEKLFGRLAGNRWKDVKADTSLRTTDHREATFTALGLGSTIAGGHYDFEIVDDWVTEDNARTALQRRRLADFWKFTVAPTREPWGRTVADGTRYHPDDFYGDVRKWQEAGLWSHVRRTRALEGDEGSYRSYWPEIYPVERLLRIREEIGSLAFSTQYQNEVDQLLGEFFERGWCERFVKWSEVPKEDRAKAKTVIALDPSIKAGPRNDFSAFVVLSYIAPYFYVRQVLRGQWTQHELIQRALYLNKVYRPAILGVEVVQGQEWLVQELKRTTTIPVRSLRPQQFRGKDKIGRASQVRKNFELARVLFETPTLANGIGRLLEEMLAFSPAAGYTPGKDDCVDALVWALLLMSRPQVRLRKLGGFR